MTVHVYVHDARGHQSPGHPERPERVAAIAEALRGAPGVEFVRDWRPLRGEDCLSVHDEAMLARTRDLAAGGGGFLDADTYVTGTTWGDALRAAGAVVDAVDAVMRGRASGAFCAVRPPGHHATPSRAMGFCVLNNVALAAEHALRRRLAKRVLVLDHDVHHGNGTQDVFYGRGDVLYQSFHLWPHYPGTGRVEETGEGDGEGFTVNAPLPFGAGDAEVATLFDEVFLPVARTFRPDLVLVSAGFDSHRDDPLGGLALTSRGYGWMAAKLRELSPNVVCVLEGGYVPRAVASGARVEVEVLISNNVPEAAPAPSRDARLLERCRQVILDLRRVHGSRWRFA